jgi:hypothetical protein
MTDCSYASHVQRGYRLANLTSLLAQLRDAGRYVGANGHISITTGELGVFDVDQAEQQIAAAVRARQNRDTKHRLVFMHPLAGLSHGLNPYTDWSMSVLEKQPNHTYLFLGLDFYSVADLAQQNGWGKYLEDPFADPDPFWHRIWAWIMNRTVDTGKQYPVWEKKISATDAASFIRADGGAFVFHNLIPYLRPAYLGSTEKNWPENELGNRFIRQYIIEDLRLIKNISHGRTLAYCTNSDAVELLKEAGFEPEDIVCWRAHPSRIFHPSTLYPRGIFFNSLNSK